MSFAGSIQMTFFSMLTCTIGSQGGPNKMATANFLWLHFLMHLSMLSRRGGRQGIGRGFDRHSWPVGRAFDRFSCPRGRII